MIFNVGLDEAGLGPLLGPLAIARSSLPSTYLQSVPDWFSPSDSKKIYKGKSAEKLETFALTLFYWAYGFFPNSCEQWFSSLGVAIHTEPAPWYSSDYQCTLPFSIPSTKRQLWQSEYSQKGEKLLHKYGSVSLNLNLISAFKLNQSLKKDNNKASCVRSFYFQLLKSFQPNDSICIDRQGGRKFYVDWYDYIVSQNSTLNPASKQILEESPTQSRYALAADKELLFAIKAEDHYPSVASASIIAKYSRELIMKRFNQYWQENSQEPLKATAGYYQDGQRFCQDLKRLNQLGYEKSIQKEYLIRKK